MAGTRERSIALGDRSLELRPCDPAADGPFIRAETVQNFKHLVEASYGWNEERHRQEPLHPEDFTMVCLEGETIGFFSLHDDPDCAYLGTILIVPKFRGSGIGTRLLEHIDVMARATGHRTLRLRVFHVNPAAALYRRMGFEVESSDKHTSIMRKMLQ
jgi:GNAT superfamily N-acetyltransferase